MGVFRWLEQLFLVTAFNLRNVPARAGASLASTVGIAGVVAVLVGVLSIAEGFSKTLVETGDPATVLVLRGGSNDEMSSGLSREEVRIIKEGPGVLRNAEGPVASAELYVVVDLPRKSTGTDANVPLRGVEPEALAVRGDVRIVAGRPPEWGTKEVLVGQGAAEAFSGLDLGSRLGFGGGDWKVVGIFTGGGVAESELWADVRVLQPAYQRGSTFQTVHLRLQDPDAFDRFSEALTTDPRLSVKVLRTHDFYASQSETLSTLVTILGTLVAGVMGLAAVFAALNTMYTAVATRTREIATLRALGFGGGPVVASVLAESLLLALVGGTAGGLLAWLLFDGFRTATLNFQSFTQVAFAFEVDGGLLARGVAYAALLGLVGGLLPAVRALRMPVATALREP